MTKVFISYSRRDKVFAEKLNSALKAIQLESWIDWDDIPPTADWWDQIEKGIQSADAFLFLISCDSATSKVCGQEIDHALKNGKRIIPLVVHDVNPNDVHPALAKLNWIFFREQDDFNFSLKKLETGIKTDLLWVESHRRLQVRAVEWEKRTDRSLLLRGKDLREAEEQLAKAGQKDPQPTDLQRRYLLESRKGESRTRNVLLTISAVVMVVLVIASVIAVRQSNYATSQAAAAIAESNRRATAEANAVSETNTRATAQANEATSRKLAEERATVARASELAAQAMLQREKNIPLSLLLGVEAFKTFENIRTKSNLLDSIQTYPFAIQYLGGHNAPVTSVAFSPDGEILASGSMDKTIILWDMENHQPIGQPLTGHFGSITSLAFSPDGKTLASGSADFNIILWDVATGKQIGHPLARHGYYVRSVAFSPDGKILASDDIDDTIILWDVVTHQPLGLPFNGHSYVTETGGAGGGGFEETWLWEGTGGQSLAFSPDGKVLASGDVHSLIFLWDTATAKPIKLLNTRSRSAITGTTFTEDEFISANQGEATSLIFNADGTLLISGVGNTIMLWDTKTYQLVGEPLTGHKANIQSLSFYPGGSILASNDYDGTVILWDPSGKSLTQLQNGHKGATKLAFSPDSRHMTLALGSYENAVALWDAEIGLWGTDFSDRGDKSTPINILPTGEKTNLTRNVATTKDECIKVIAIFSPDGKTLSIAKPFSNYIELLNGQTFNPADEIHPEQYSFETDNSALAYSPDSRLLAIGGTKGVFLWDLPQHHLVGKPFGRDIVHLVFTLDGKTIITVNKDGIIHSWDIATQQTIGKPIETKSHPYYHYQVAFSPDRKIFASLENNEITLWDLASGQPSGQPLTEHRAYSSLTFSGDGQILASSVWDPSMGDSIILWDVATHQMIGQPFKGKSICGNITFSPDNKTLAFGNLNTVELWDIPTHQLVGQPIVGHLWPVSAVAFRQDGKALASGSYDSVFMQNLDPLFWLGENCRRAGRNLTYAEWSQYFPGENYRKTCNEWPLHSSILENMARQALSSHNSSQNVQLAYDTVKIALQNEPNIEAPLAETARIIQQIVGEQIITEVKAGRFEQAQSLYNQLKSIRLTMTEGAKSQILMITREQVRSVAVIGDFKQAQSLIEHTKSLGIEMTDINTLNLLCWFKSLWGYARDALPYCEQAINLMPGTGNGYIRDSRGVARALIGDFEGAILDFQYFIDEQIKLENGNSNLVKQRQQWISDLKADKNPFTPEVIEMLKSQ